MSVLGFNIDSDLKQLSRLIVTAIISLSCAEFIQMQEVYWLVLSALLIVSISPENSFWKSQFIIMGWGLLLAAHVGLANYFSGGLEPVTLYFLLTAWISFYFSFRNIQYQYPLFVLNILGVVSAGMSGQLHLSVERSAFILLSIIIVLGVRSVFWPDTLRQNLIRYEDHILKTLNELQKKLFVIYLKRDYIDNYFSYEKMLHQYRFAFFESIEKMREINRLLPAPKQALVSQKIMLLESLFARISAISSLRYRINDIATLEICENELLHISDVITYSFQRLIAHETFEMPEVTISALEEIFEATLQVISPEPWVISIFIQDMNGLFLTLNELAQENQWI